MKPDNRVIFPYDARTHDKIYIFLCIFIFFAAPVKSISQTPDGLFTALTNNAYQLQDTTRIVRSPHKAMYRSLAFPGWGQWYNERKLKSALIFTAETSVTAAIFIQHHRLTTSENKQQRDFYRDDRNKFIWWLGGIIIYSMLDAYVDAYLQNFDVDMNINKGVNPAVTVRFTYTFSASRLF